jgi:glycosyltransferase involved in cell wall biosynthesis
VINTPADRELSYRTGLSPHVIPNILNFAEPAPGIDEYNADVRRDLGLAEDDIFFLQPTRIVARKGIEHAIEIVNRLKNPRVKLVISHSAGDEGLAYEQRIRSYAEIMNVPLIIKPEIIGTERGTTPDGQKVYTLWDIYPHADLITYPSMYEGFGNAFLEAIYFRKPIVVNRYSIYEVDIEPIGFDVISMNGYVTDDVIQKIRHLFDHPETREQSAEKNYQLASQFFSYEVLAYKLMTIMIHFEGLAEYSTP